MIIIDGDYVQTLNYSKQRFGNLEHDVLISINKNLTKLKNTIKIKILFSFGWVFGAQIDDRKVFFFIWPSMVKSENSLDFCFTVFWFMEHILYTDFENIDIYFYVVD